VGSSERANGTPEPAPDEPTAGRRLSPLSPLVHAWIEHSAGPDVHVVAVESLPLSSTSKHRITVVAGDGSRRQLLLRRYHDAPRLAHDPWYVPAHEAQALFLLARGPTPTPRLLAADLEANLCEVPALLESWLPGHVEWRPVELARYLRCTAEALVAFHAAGVAPEGLPDYAPYADRCRMASPPFTTRPGLWERVARELDRPRPDGRAVFIHRDWHPGNLLWDGERLTGVVDWATAARGPAGIDLARMRLNLAWRIGSEAAAAFLAAYVSAGGDAAARDPYWDLLDAADAMPIEGPPPSEAELASFETWVTSVLAELGR